MSARTFNYDDDDDGPNIGVKELVKMPRSSSSTRLEYLRMRAEKAIVDKAQNILSPVEESPEIDESEKRASVSAEDNVSQIQESEPEIKSFPFDNVDGGVKKKATKHLGANEHPGHKHGGKLCMVSAMIHMKSLATRQPKSIKQLKKSPMTTQEEKTRHTHAHGDDDGSDSESEDEFADIKTCRYIRGGLQDKELTIDQIFG